jgi:carbonic anhydrase/acetyltransferase-like protein (isoleucine patch superfamily)
MIKNANVDEIRSWPQENGWHVSPAGDRVKLGDNVTLRKGVKLGNWVTLGDNVTLGKGVTLGHRVTLGNRVTLGEWVKLGDRVRLGIGVKLGDGVKLGYWVELGDRVVLPSTPPQALRSDGYTFCLYSHNHTLRITAGCRDFTIEEAREHWTRTRGGTPLGEESLAIIDHLLRVYEIQSKYRVREGASK